VNTHPGALGIGVLACFVMATCGPSRVTDEDLRPPSEEQPRPSRKPASPPETPIERVEPRSSGGGAPAGAPLAYEIQRADLERVLRRGPGAFLGQVQIEPAFDANRRFAGFRIKTLMLGNKEIPTDLVRIGDVVMRINGRRLARPEDLFDIWQALYKADELRLEGRRGADPFNVRYQISPPAKPPEPPK